METNQRGNEQPGYLIHKTFFTIFELTFRGYSSAGRALEWHSRGQEFDPP